MTLSQQGFDSTVAHGRTQSSADISQDESGLAVTLCARGWAEEDSGRLQSA